MLAILALLLVLVGCAAEPPASCGALGRVAACACPGGAQGAQECGPFGVWGACACPSTDAGAEAAAPDAPPPPVDGPGAPDAGADAPEVAADASAPPDGPTDAPAEAAAPDAPSRPCSVVSDCGTLRPGWAPSCVAGGCVDVCPPNSADCDGDPSNACEAILSNRLSCGACGRVCPSRCDRLADGTYRCS